MAIPNAQNDDRSLFLQELQQEQENVQKVLGRVAGGAKELLNDFDQQRAAGGIDATLDGLRQAVSILEGNATRSHRLAGGTSDWPRSI